MKLIVNLDWSEWYTVSIDENTTTAQKIKFSIQGFFIFCAVYPTDKYLLNENNALNKYYTEFVKSKHERQ